MSNSYQNNQEDVSDVVIIGESPGFKKQQPSQVSYQPPPQQYQNPNYQGNNNNFQGSNNSFQGNSSNYQNNNISFQTSSQNFQGQNYNPQNFQAVNNVTPQKNRNYSNPSVSPNIQGYNQFTSPPRQQNYRVASPRFQSPGRGGHQQYNLSPRQQSPRPLLSAQQLQEILNSPKGKRLTQQQRNYLIQQQALREKQLQQAATPPRPIAPPRQTTPVAVRYQINNSPSYSAPLERRPSQETNFAPPVTDPFKNLPREPVTIDLIEPEQESENQKVTTPPILMETSENAVCNLMSTLDDLNREKQQELNAVFAETNTDIETDKADENGNPNDSNDLISANDTTDNPKSPDPTSVPVPIKSPSTESVVPKIMEEIMIAKQEKPDSDGENEDVLPKLDDTSNEPLTSVPDIAMDDTEKNKDAGVLSDAKNTSTNQDLAKKRGRPKKTSSPFVDESDPGIRALIENGLDDPYSPEVDADDDEDYCPKPKKRRSKVHSKPHVRPPNTETNNTISDSGIGTSVSSTDHAEDDEAFDLNVPASDRQLRVKLTPVTPVQMPETITDDSNLPDESKENSDGEPLTKVKPLILRLHHQKLSEDRRFKTFKNLSTSVRKAKLHAKRSKKKSLSPEKAQSEGLQDTNINEDQGNLEATAADTTAKKPLGGKRGRKKIQTKPVTVKRGRGRPRVKTASPQKEDSTNDTDSSRAVSRPTGLVWPVKGSKNKNSKSDTTNELSAEEALSLSSKYSSRSSTPQARTEISLPPPVLPSELDLLPSIVASQEHPPDISPEYVDQGPLASTSKLEEESISPPVFCSTRRRSSESSSTKSSKKHNKKKTTNNGVAKEIEAVVSGLFGENFMNMSESSGYTVNITFDVEKKPSFPSNSNGTSAKSEKNEETGTKNLRERKPNLEKCDPNFFTNSELCSILQKRIANHPGIGSDLKAAYSDSIQHVQRLLDGNSK